MVGHKLHSLGVRPWQYLTANAKGTAASRTDRETQLRRSFPSGGGGADCREMSGLMIKLCRAKYLLQSIFGAGTARRPALWMPSPDDLRV